MNSIKHSASYFIVEFEDGVQLVPQNWMTQENKAAYWPNFTNNVRYDKAVKEKESPRDSWQIFPVMKILGTAQTYEKGKERLKEAEAFSEVNNSDVDEVQLKQTRRKRARIMPVISDEESDIGDDAQYKLAPFPSSPHFDLRQPETHVSNKPKHTNMTDHTDTDLPNTSIAIPQTSFSVPQISNRHSHKRFGQRDSVTRYEDDFQDELSESSCSSKSSVLQLQNMPQKRSKLRPATATPVQSLLSSMDESSMTSIPVNAGFQAYQRFVVRSLTALKMKINNIVEAVEDIVTKQDSTVIETNNLDSMKSSEKMAEIMKRFPLKDLIAVEEIESDLTDENYKRQLMNTLAKIGGADIKIRAKKLMERLFTNSVAEKFSWIGGKKKQIFSNLLICTVILDVVRLPTPHATDEDIALPIKNWLRHAKERLDREKMRTAKVVEPGAVDENGEDAITEEVADDN